MTDFKQSCILNTAYWGPVQYYSKFLLFPEIYIEQYETYPKQTYRNRCVVYGPNGIQSLQVPVEGGSFHKIMTKDIRIAYHTSWQKNHLSTLETVYKSSPFYEYYIDDIYPFYQKKYSFLIDYNSDINSVCLKWLKLDIKPKLTTGFIKPFEGHDLRNTIHPKAQKEVEDKLFKPVFYLQVFSERNGFIGNLSILDLIMNTGPDAKAILNKCIAV
jgi:hypothetical protein